MNADAVVGHGVSLGLEPGVWQSFVDVLLQIVEFLLQRSKVRRRKHVMNLVHEFRMILENVGDE